MADLDSFSDQLGGESSLASFSLEESQALADLAVLVIMVDRRVTDEELTELSESLRELPFDSERDVEEALGEHMEAAKKAAEAFEDDDGALDDYISERAKTIESEEHREAALEKLAELIYSDGAAADEESILHQIGEGFGMDEQKVQIGRAHV